MGMLRRGVSMPKWPTHWRIRARARVRHTYVHPHPHTHTPTTTHPHTHTHTHTHTRTYSHTHTFNPMKTSSWRRSPTSGLPGMKSASTSATLLCSKGHMSLPRQGPRPMSSVSLCRACECTLCCAAGTGGDGAGGGASSGPPGAGGAGGAAWCWSWGTMLDMARAYLRTDRRMHTRTNMRTHARTHARTRAQPHTKRTHACTHARAPSPPLKHHLGSSHIHGPPVPKRRRPPAELHSTQCESRPATHAKPCVAAGGELGV